jgi:hypothetical protein
MVSDGITRTAPLSADAANSAYAFSDSGICRSRSVGLKASLLFAFSFAQRADS